MIGGLIISGVRARRTTKPIAETSCEMRITAKAVGIGDLAQGLARPKQRAPLQKMRGMTQAKRIDEFVAGCAALDKQLLNVT
jgi:hypothetical protein